MEVFCFLAVLFASSSQLVNGQGQGHSNSTLLRLAGAGSNGTGRLEVFYDGRWSTFYDSYFTYEDAQVACRMLGYSSGVVTMFPTNSDLFGHASSSYQVRVQFRCAGDETDLHKCSGGARTWSVYHSPRTSRGNSDVEISCEGTQIRLVDGDSVSSGRVEIFLNNEWNTICDYQFGDADAKVICGMLGFGNSTIAKAYSHGHYGQGMGVQLVSNLRCDGTEADIKQCPAVWGHYGHYSNCNHRADAGVNCGSTQVRLVDGPTRASGRVEVLHAGKWGSICSDGRTFTRQNVLVICRTLGYNNPDAFGFATSVFGEGTGHVALRSLNCDGSELDIASCHSSEWSGPYDTQTSCPHTYDVGVNCDAKTPIRLVNGDSEQSGRLEIQTVAGHWGTMSDHGFDRHDLQVVCRMLGYEFSERSFFMKSAYYGPGVGQVLVSNLNCDGDEADIGQCGGTWTPTSDHTHDVGVSCDGDMTVRLVGGHNNASGRVEFLQGGYYKTVCSNGFDRADFIVVCRMLGYENIPSSASWRTVATYNQGLGQIGAASLTCDGTEATIGQCGGTFPSTSYSCHHQQDLYVNCNGEPEPMRLVGGSSQYSGRVEVQVSGRWGTICGNRGFTREDAIVICRIMKFKNPEAAVAYPRGHFGQGNGTIVMSNIQCTGIESNLDQCGVTMTTTGCSHTYDVSVDCCPSGSDCDSDQTFIIG